MSTTPTSFSALKRSRGSVESLTKAIQASTQNKREDDRFWELTVDKAKNGYATIRFLDTPSQDGEEGLPWVRTFSHSFQGPGGWLIELCPTTLDHKCPVCEANGLLWNSGIEANKKIARDRKRKLSYTSNIMVVADPTNPEHNGQVKLFRYGKKIHDRVVEMCKADPTDPERAVYNPYNLWDGADFKLRARQVDGYRNYDKSEFAAPKPVKDSDADIEALWKSEHALLEFVSPGNFKTYDQIKSRLIKVLGGAVAAPSAETAGTQAFNDVDAGVKSTDLADDPVEMGEPAGGEEEDLQFFKSLAQG